MMFIYKIYQGKGVSIEKQIQDVFEFIDMENINSMETKLKTFTELVIYLYKDNVHLGDITIEKHPEIETTIQEYIDTKNKNVIEKETRKEKRQPKIANILFLISILVSIFFAFYFNKS